MDQAAAFRESWLGIPQVEQPVNHYRLLRLPRDASEREVVRSYESRLQLLKPQLQGQNAAIARQLIGEVQIARDCLLDPDARRAYDWELDTHPRPRPHPRPEPISAQAQLIEIAPAPDPSALHGLLFGRPRQAWMAGGLVAVAALIAIAVVLSLKGPPSSPQVAADVPADQAKSASPELLEKTVTGVDEVEEIAVSEAAKQPEEPQARVVVESRIEEPGNEPTEQRVAVVETRPAESSAEASAEKSATVAPMEKQPGGKDSAPESKSTSLPEKAIAAIVPHSDAASAAPHDVSMVELPAKSLKEIREIKAVFQKEFANKSPAMRVAALEKLADLPRPDIAHLILRSGLRDKSDEVRKTATDLLVEFQKRPEVAKFLLEQLQNSAQGGGHSWTPAGVIRVLGHSQNAELQRAAVQCLEQAMQSSLENSRAVFQLVDDAGLQRDASTVSTLTLLSKIKFFESEFGYRRALLHALIRSQNTDSLPLLISMIPSSTGLIQQELIEYLTTATSQPFLADVGGWQKWWEQNQATFKFGRPVVAAGAPGAPTESGGFRKYVEDRTPKYYKIPIYANRIVFVIDTSGSMQGERIEAAKRELISAITQLPESAEFGIVVFNSTAHSWRPKLVEAETYNKASATHIVGSLVAHGSTASYDALVAAFNLNPEMIFFLSDGSPTTGEFVAPPDILRAIGTLNFTRRVSIHTIGIGAGGSLQGFMQTLAANNFGKYVAVNH